MGLLCKDRVNKAVQPEKISGGTVLNLYLTGEFSCRLSEGQFANSQSAVQSVVDTVKSEYCSYLSSRNGAMQMHVTIFLHGTDN